MIDRKVPELKRIEPKFSFGDHSATDFETSEPTSAANKSSAAAHTPLAQPIRPERAALTAGLGQSQVVLALGCLVLGFVLVASLFLVVQNRGMQSELSELRQLASNTAAQSSALSLQVSQTGQSLNQAEGNLETQFRTLQQSLERLAENNSKLESLIKDAKTALDQRLDALARVDNGIKGDVAKQTALVSEQSKDLAQLKKTSGQLVPLAASVSSLESRLSELDNLKVQLGQLNTEITQKLNWQDSVTGLEAALDSVDIFRQQTNQSLDRLERSVRQIDQRINSSLGVLEDVSG